VNKVVDATSKPDSSGVLFELKPFLIVVSERADYSND